MQRVVEEKLISLYLIVIGFPYSVLPCTENQCTVENVENFHSRVNATSTPISYIRAERPKRPSTAILVPYPYRNTTHPICTAYSANGSVFRPEMIQLRKPIKITGSCQMLTATAKTEKHPYRLTIVPNLGYFSVKY